MSWQEADKQADAIVEMIDDLPEEVHEKAAAFFDDVRSRVISVQETICERERVSEKQQAALDGWESAIRKWVHDE